MLNVIALLISLLATSVSPADVIGGGGPGVTAPTPAPIVAPADVIGGGGPGTH